MGNDGHSPSGKALDSDSSIRRFESFVPSSPFDIYRRDFLCIILIEKQQYIQARIYTAVFAYCNINGGWICGAVIVYMYKYMLEPRIHLQETRRQDWRSILR